MPFRSQWSSDSTVGVSPSVAVENGRRRQQLQHHHHHLHHYYHLAAMKQEAENAAGNSTAAAAIAKTHGVNGSGDDDGCSGCSGVAVEDAEDDEHQSDSDVDVCACCSEWLSKALLCSCQVIQNLAGSSPKFC